MDFLTIVDAGLIGSIMACMEILKSLDKNKKLMRLYPLFVLVLASAAAYVKSDPMTLRIYLYNLFLYAGASSYIFKFGKTTLLGR